MTMFEEMSLSELEAFAAKLQAQVNRSGRAEGDKIELQDVRNWIALRKREAESCPEPIEFGFAPEVLS